MSMPSFEVVPFSPSYGPRVVELILSIQQNEFGVPITLSDQPDLQDIPRFYQKGCGNFWVAVENERVIGTIALLDIGNREATLRKMFVAASHRGASRGVANRLLEALQRWARAQGVRSVFLGTTAKFVAAHRFYEKQCFEEIPREALPASFPVMTVDTKLYRQDLE